MSYHTVTKTLLDMAKLYQADMNAAVDYLEKQDMLI